MMISFGLAIVGMIVSALMGAVLCLFIGRWIQPAETSQDADVQGNGNIVNQITLIALWIGQNGLPDDDKSQKLLMEATLEDILLKILERQSKV